MRAGCAGRRGLPTRSASTLIELMVSMLLLSVVLAAAAGSLITFSRAHGRERAARPGDGADEPAARGAPVRSPWFDAAVYEARATRCSTPSPASPTELGGRRARHDRRPVLDRVRDTSRIPTATGASVYPAAYFSTQLDGTTTRCSRPSPGRTAAADQTVHHRGALAAARGRDLEERFESERAPPRRRQVTRPCPVSSSSRSGPSPMALSHRRSADPWIATARTSTSWSASARPWIPPS